MTWSRFARFARFARRTRVAPIALLLATADPRGEARAQESADDWVIPSGQDAALRRLAAADTGLAGCSLEIADAQRTEIRLEYLCDGAPFRFVLRHRSGDDCAAFCTETFDVEVDGAERPALTRALTASVRAHEAGFEFVRAAYAPRGGSGSSFAARMPSAVRIGIAAGIAAVIALFLRGGRADPSASPRPAREPGPAPGADGEHQGDDRGA